MEGQPAPQPLGTELWFSDLQPLFTPFYPSPYAVEVCTHVLLWTSCGSVHACSPMDMLWECVRMFSYRPKCNLASFWRGSGGI